MATVTLTADGAAVEVVAAASTLAIVQNISSTSVVIANLADPAAGLVLYPKEKLVIDSAWTAAWNGKSLNGVAALLRVVQQ